MKAIEHGCNLLVAIRYARDQGCTVSQPRRTGELVVSHPAMSGERVRVNGRRKDAPRALTTFLKKLGVARN
jgi:hypothetical protein